MKRILVLFVAWLAVSAAYAQGMEFRTESYAEVLKMAKKQKKLVFVDIYTSWCGPCKHMATQIFTQKEAGDFYNEHFLCLKLDAEKSADGKAVASRFGVSAYPTMLFVDGNGDLVYRLLGGKPLDQFVAEGRKALEAYAMKPLLEKNAKLYLKGRRDKKFLNDYFELRDKAGLDGSEVLVNYFAQVKNEELLDSTNVSRIAKVTVYEPDLAKRYVDAVCREVKNGKERHELKEVKKLLCTYLGACLKDAAKSDDESKLEEVLGLKARLFEALDINESVTMASLGGGNIYLFSDMMRLDYYDNKGKKELFVSLYERYVEKIISEYARKQATREVLEEGLNKKMQAAKEAGNETEYDGLKKMRGLMSAFSGMDDYYISTGLVNDLETYVRYYAGVKDKAFEDKIVSWYRALHRVQPSVKTAVYVADKLLEMGRKQEAVEELAYALEKGMEAVAVEPADQEACRNKWEELSK